MAELSLPAGCFYFGVKQLIEGPADNKGLSHPISYRMGLTGSWMTTLGTYGLGRAVFWVGLTDFLKGAGDSRLGTA